MNDAARPRVHYYRPVTGLLIAVLLLVAAVMALKPPARGLQTLDRPVATSIKVQERLLDLAAVNGSGWWAWFRGWTVDLSGRQPQEALQAYGQVLAGLPAGQSAPERVALGARRAVILAVGADREQARAELRELERWGAAGKRMAAVVGHALLGEGARPSEADLQAALADLGVAGAPAEGWTADQIRLHLHRLHGEPAAAATVEQGQRARLAPLRVGAQTLATIDCLTLLIALLLLLRARLRGVPLFPRLADAPLPPPWPPGDGLAVVVRALVMGMVVGGICAVGLEKATGADATGVAFLAAGLPGYLYIRRGLLSPQAHNWAGAFGLRARVTWSTILGVVVVLVAVNQVLALLSNLAGSWLGRPGSWLDLVDETAVSGAPWEAGAMALAAVVGAPLYEEILFRGVIYASLRSRMPALWAAMISGLIFALVHGYSPVATVHLFLGATIWALVYERTRSLLPSLLDHSLNNVFAATGDLLLR